MHEQTTYNKYYQKFADFKEAVLGFFENIDKYKAIVKNIINDKLFRN